MTKKRYDLTFDDLFQEGCIHLIHAAETYNPEKGAKFRTYAETVIKNGLLSYCRKSPGLYTGTPYPEQIADEYRFEKWFDLLWLLERIAETASPTEQLGLRALIMQAVGYSMSEIAEQTAFSKNYITACMTKAKIKIRSSDIFLEAI